MGYPMKKRTCLWILCLLLAPASWAEVTVEIVDYPSRILMYTPILVTAKVENTGTTPVLIPTTGDSSTSHFIMTGATPEKFAVYNPVLTDGGGYTTWLKPGEARFFQVDVGHFWFYELGRLYLKARIQSNGKCLYIGTEEEALSRKVVDERMGFKWYECWSGSVTSDVVFVDIVEPDTIIDREALEYYLSMDLPMPAMRGENGLRLLTARIELSERFPSSYYDYAARFYAYYLSVPGADLPELQPNHPLTPYLRFQLAQALLRKGQEARVTVPFVDGLGLPDGVEQYLLQTARESRQVAPKGE